MKSIIYPRSGKFVLVKYNTDGTLTPSDDTIVAANGVVQSVEASVTINTSELADGNSDFPMGVFDVGKTGQLVITMSSFQPALYAALMGSKVEEEDSATLWAAEEEITVPSESPYTVTLSHTPKSDGTLVIVNDEGSPLVKAPSSSPSTGQYSVSAATVEFASTDAGKIMFATYEWTASQVTKMGLPEVGSRPVLHAIISTEATDEGELTKYDANIIVDKCKAIGDINQPTQQREPQAWNFTLRVLKPRPGYNPVYWKFAKKTST